MLIPFLNAKITSVTQNALLFTVQHFTGENEAMNVGRRGVNAVDQPDGVINPDVYLHATVPLVSFLGLVLGFGEGNLIHDGTESRAVDDGRIIADFETFSESP